MLRVTAKYCSASTYEIKNLYSFHQKGLTGLSPRITLWVQPVLAFSGPAHSPWRNPIEKAQTRSAQGREGDGGITSILPQILPGA